MDVINLGKEAQKAVFELERNNPDLPASARIKAAWNSCIDNSIKKHVTGLFIVPNTHNEEIIVYVDTSIFATELSMQTEMIKLKLNMELNQMAVNDGQDRESIYNEGKSEQVKKLRFVVSREQYFAKERRLTTKEIFEEENNKLKDVSPEPLDDADLQQLLCAVESIENEELRTSAFEAAKANMEWQKGLKKIEDEEVNKA